MKYGINEEFVKKNRKKEKEYLILNSNLSDKVEGKHAIDSPGMPKSAEVTVIILNQLLIQIIIILKVNGSEDSEMMTPHPKEKLKPTNHPEKRNYIPTTQVPPEEYLLEENEERSMIEPKSYDNPKLKSLIR